MKKILLALVIAYSSSTYAQTAKDDLINSILGNKFDSEITILGENGEDTLRISTLRTKVLIIKNNVTIINPRGNSFAVVINCDTVISRRNSKISSASDINIFANYGGGILTVENTRGVSGRDGTNYITPQTPISNAASGGPAGHGGRDAGCETKPTSIRRWSSKSGDNGHRGSSGQKGLIGNTGETGEDGTASGSVIFICKSFHPDAEIYVNAVGGKGGNGGIGQTGGKGQNGGNGGKGGNGGESGCGRGSSGGGSGGNGGNGGDGGDGGDGGVGGNGGDGGFVKIFSLKSSVSPQLYVVNNLGGEEGDGNQGGEGGEGGVGGKGGIGGKGGNGDLWRGPSGGGQGGGPGNDGEKGVNGRSGKDGLKGKRGKILVADGNFYLTVEENRITEIIRETITNSELAL
ncbi:MAG: hypothetical protein V4721_03400 [Bacteroidota bacterium]